MNEFVRRLAAFACTCLVACSGSEDGVEDAETTATTSQPIIYGPATPAGQVVNWGYQYEYNKQGTAGRQLMNSLKGVCFLSAVTGSFAVASDMIEVVDVDGAWVIRGRRLQVPLSPNTLGGDAFCVSGAGLTVTDEIDVPPDTRFTVAPHAAATKTCFLSRVSGMTGPGSQIQVLQAGDGWDAETFGASGAVRCINRPTISTGSITSGGHSMLSVESSNLGHVCILTGLRGQLTSTSKYVGMRLNGSAAPYYWELNAQLGLSGWAACVN